MTTNIITGSLRTEIFNSMIVNVEVAKPPIKTIQSQPVKDSLVWSAGPYINFGAGEELSIGTVAGDGSYKSILCFKTPILPLDYSHDNLEFARLTFKLTRTVKTEALLSLYIADSSDWTETGVNYKNIPNETTLVDTIIIPPNSTNVSFDIGSYIKSLPVTDLTSFIIVDESGVEYFTPITFGSKESSTPPILEYGYLYYPPSADSVDIKGSLTVAQNNSKDLTGSFTIIGGYSNSDLVGSLTIDKIYDHKDLTGSLTVKRDNVIDLTGSLTIDKTYDHKDLTGSLNILGNGEKDLTGSLTIDKIDDHKDLTGSFTLTKEEGIKDFNGSLTIQKINNFTDLGGSLTIDKIDDHKDLTGSLTVIAAGQVDLTGSLTIDKIDDHKDLTGSLFIRDQFVFDLNGSLTIPKIYDHKDLTGSLNILGNGEKDLTGSLTIDKIDDHKDLTGSFTLTKEEGIKDLCGSVIVKPMWAKDLQGSLIVVSGDKSYAFIM